MVIARYSSPNALERTLWNCILSWMQPFVLNSTDIPSGALAHRASAIFRTIGFIPCCAGLRGSSSAALCAAGSPCCSVPTLENGFKVKALALGERSGSSRLSTSREGACTCVWRTKGGFCIPGMTPVATCTTCDGPCALRNGMEKFCVRRRL